GRGLSGQGQAMPGLALTEFPSLEADGARCRRALVAAPRLIPGATTGYECRHRDDPRLLIVELAVVVRVPAVAADQHAQTSRRSFDDVERVLAIGLDRILLFKKRLHLTLGLADWQAVTTELYAAVVQGAA